MADWFDVTPVEALPPGDSCTVALDSGPVAVFNLGGEYHAIEDLCTHDGAPMLSCGLPTEEVVEGEVLICPRHGARFCIRTGKALTPPAYEDVHKFPTRVEAGMVQVLDDLE